MSDNLKIEKLCQKYYQKGYAAGYKRQQQSCQNDEWSECIYYFIIITLFILLIIIFIYFYLKDKNKLNFS
jgi:hypothetical protein